LPRLPTRSEVTSVVFLVCSALVKTPRAESAMCEALSSSDWTVRLTSSTPVACCVDADSWCCADA